MLYYRVFLRIADHEPVYHDLQHYVRHRPNDMRKTVCGRPVAVWKPLIPTEHARKFGHPCKDCFPGGDSDRGQD